MATLANALDGNPQSVNSNGSDVAQYGYANKDCYKWKIERID